MTIDPIERRKLSTIVFTSTEPSSTNVLWGKPEGNTVKLYIFRNGSWERLKNEEIDEIVKVYIDNQDTLTLSTAKQYADTSISAIRNEMNTALTIPIIISTDAAITLCPNKMYDITCSGDLSITLQEPTDKNTVNIYMCNITTSSEIGTIILPTNIIWNDDTTIEASSFYEINIRYSGGSYFGIIHKWGER